MSWFDWISLVGSISSTLSLLVLVPGWIIWIRHHETYIKVTLSCGSFQVLRKHYNRIDLTPIVSTLFFHGGNVPDDVRKEINELMCKQQIDYKNIHSTKA